MHTYASNKTYTPNLIAVIAFIAIAIDQFLGGAVAALSTRLGFNFGGFSVLAVFGVLYLIFDKWLWKREWIRRMLLVPNLNGAWSCSGHTKTREGLPVDTPWDAEILIVQSWSRISVCLKTKTSASHSIAASLYLEPGRGYRLIYHYDNKPRVGASELRRHNGLADLMFDDSGASAEGQYFTDGDRMTVGEMHLTRKDEN